MIKSKSLEPNFRFLSYSNEKKGGIDSLKFLWLSAKWSELADIEYSKIEKIDSEGWGALLIGSANHVLGNIVRVNELFLTAKRKGITEKTIKTTLFSNVLNSMARSFALKGDEEKALQYFNRSLLILLGESAAKSYENIRYISELGSLGLIPSAGKIINKRVNSIDLTQRPSIIESKLDIIKTELELINHNIMLSHQKNQFYNIPEEKAAKELSFEQRIKELSPSQLGQDLWVLEKFSFKRNGFFVEFGATDGILLSNTYLLEREFGWSGLLAEPNPKFFKNLKANRTSQCFDSCISKRTGDKVEFVLADEFGGIGDFALTGKHKGKVSSYKNNEDVIELTTISLEDFLINNNAPRYIEYLSIDTEGSEFSILENFPFDSWDIELITVEHNFEPQRELIFKLLTGFGYKRIESKWDDWYFKE